jgi:predicted RNA methylase
MQQDHGMEEEKEDAVKSTQLVKPILWSSLFKKNEADIDTHTLNTTKVTTTTIPNKPTTTVVSPPKLSLKPFRDTTIEYDTVATYSSTPESVAFKWTKHLSERLGNNLRVFDACACIGINTMFFARYFKHVYATEIDKTRFDMLARNIEKKRMSWNISLFCNDFRVVCPNISADIVFLDFPWGGVSYDRNKDFSLKTHIKIEYNPTYNIKEQTGYDIVKQYIQNKKYKYIVIKLPRNAKENDFDDLVDPHQIVWDYFLKLKFATITC